MISLPVADIVRRPLMPHPRWYGADCEMVCRSLRLLFPSYGPPHYGSWWSLGLPITREAVKYWATVWRAWFYRNQADQLKLYYDHRLRRSPYIVLWTPDLSHRQNHVPDFRGVHKIRLPYLPRFPLKVFPH